MMYTFLANNRDELVERCKAKVAARPQREATTAQLANGIPLFIRQLTRTLQAEEIGDAAHGVEISGKAGGDILALSEIGTSATAHGASLLGLGYTVDQVVHDYGDLCQAITDLAFERDAPFAVAEFRTLNRCLDNAIADAVVGFSAQRDATMLERHVQETRERVGFLVHELRNAASTATFAIGAIEHGNLPMSGATGAVLKRSLAALSTLIDRAIGEVRLGVNDAIQVFDVATLLADAQAAAALDANAIRCRLTVLSTSPSLLVSGNRGLLLAALGNLLQNAFKFTRPDTDVTLIAHVVGDKVLIEVEDRCGGLSRASNEKMFTPFSQRDADRTGLGLGLPIARHNVEEHGGTLTVRDVPDVGCVFVLTLPLFVPDDAAAPPPRAT